MNTAPNDADPAPLASTLLEAALALGRSREAPAMLAHLARALAPLEGTRWVGMALSNEREGGVTYHLRALDAPRVHTLEGVSEEDDPLDHGADRPRILDLGPPSPLPVVRCMRELSPAPERGSCLGLPLRLEDRRLGTLLVGRAGDARPRPGELDHLEPLADFLAGRLWALLSHERFQSGDRRRDALYALSAVINASLDAEVVLERATQAIASIEGHAHSWIGILEPDGAHFRRVEVASPGREPATEPRPIEGTVLERLTDDAEPYLSGDLQREAPLADDAELLARGVRRYVATPLRAGGRTIGALLFGSRDERPPAPVDLWLFENVALQLALALENARRHGELEQLSARRAQHNRYLSEEIQSEHNFGEMVGSSPALREVCSNIQRVARTDSTVLITGPTGVGKELVARAIHAAGRSSEQPMVKLNCAAIAEGMVESELFGHERGAFTSAVERRIGRFELAQDGTLFLDEIGELPLSVQTKLLRVLQDGDFERVGGTQTLHSNARILAATNRDLYQGIEKGTFRADLFYRLNVFPIDVPGLHERREDIPLLTHFFVEQFNRAMGKSILSIDPSSMEYLLERDWPGNVRELKHVIERAIILCDGDQLRIDETPGQRTRAATGSPERPAPLRELREVEALHIRRALEASGWVIEGPRGAAQKLGLKGSTLRFRMRRLGIERPSRTAP